MEDPQNKSEKASYLRWKDGKPTGCTLGGQHPERGSEDIKCILWHFREVRPRMSLGLGACVAVITADPAHHSSSEYPSPPRKSQLPLQAGLSECSQQ